jgi:hypothetical protein
MSWDRIQRGYKAVNEQFGESIYNVNSMALMSYQAFDLNYSNSLFKQVGENWDRELWLSHDRFDSTRNMAWMNLAAMRYKEAMKNARTPEGQTFAAGLSETINKNYHDKLLACVQATSSVRSDKLSFLMQVTTAGKAHEVVFPSPNVPDACLNLELEKGVFAAPPHDDYWVLVAVNVK